jgi:hypothetical protein
MYPSSMLVDARRILNKGCQLTWLGIRPALVLALGVITGIIVAIVIRSFLVQILNILVKCEHYIATHVSLLHLPGADPSAPKDPTKLDLGLTTFGVAVVLATVKETSTAVTGVVKSWMTANVTVLLPAYLSVAVAFAALGLSVYGLQELKGPTAGMSIAFNSGNIPPALLEPQTGHVTFYIAFGEEGGAKTFTVPNHLSVTLAPADEQFLKALAKGLSACATAGEPVKIDVSGFASSSLWNTAGELDALKVEDADQRAELARARIYVQDQIEHPSDPSDTPAFVPAHAFNAYLANRRRQVVINRLGASERSLPVTTAKIEVQNPPWPNFASMQNGLAIDDSRGAGTIATRGILTRSVAITIEDARSCARSIKLESAAVSVHP